MSKKLKVIALISGGKDSLFSIVHCLENGHEVVALANLFPEDAATEDSESYMYQTIGHALIPLYAQVLGLPLYRAPITGAAASTDRIYHYLRSQGGQDTTSIGSREVASQLVVNTTAIKSDVKEEDETEALIPLLTHIISQHPEANAVSTGAILSTYQRTRIESIASRLNLISIAYLWQYPFLPPYTQTSLLHDIGSVAQASRIVKTASGALGEKHLWSSVGEELVVKGLSRDLTRFSGAEELEGGAILGEGGEYETLTLSGPAPLWKGRIEVRDKDREIVAGEGGSWSVRIKDAVVIEDIPGTNMKPRVPEVYDVEFADLLERLRQQGIATHRTGRPKPQNSDSDHNTRIQDSCDNLARSMPTTSTHYISNLRGQTSTLVNSQMADIASQLQSSLQFHNLTPDDLTNTTILLRNMSDFAAINGIYGALFTQASPPARVTVACGDSLPQGVDVILSATASRATREGHAKGRSVHGVRRGLHVQSRSYWAPANIGPYSQAIATPLTHPLASTSDQDDDEIPNSQAQQIEVVQVAGQIPLVPSSMDLLPHDFIAQTVLALQHLWRIGRAMEVRWWAGGGVAFITADGEGEAKKQLQIAVAAWRGIQELIGESNEDEDIEEEIDIAERSLRSPWGKGSSTDRAVSVKTKRLPLPNYDGVRLIGGSAEEARTNQDTTPACVIVQVDELPRGAAVEWASFGLTGESLRVGMRKELGLSSCEALLDGGDFRVTWMECCTAEELNIFCASVIPDGESGKGEQIAGLFEVFTAQGDKLGSVLMANAEVMVIPCRHVWNEQGEELYAAIRHRGYFASNH